ncbi:MAG: bifunctional tetrahydrofolate synthase/dihydrofolate synthase [Tahibacter sp.]
MTRTLEQWLDYQQIVHVRGIDLGLDRVREVWLRLGRMAPAPIVITVGGTNGKGSTVALLEAMLRAGGHRVGCYTSPHLLHYNERIRVEGSDASDSTLIEAFERIEEARGDVSLTYFEFATLAALLIFSESGIEVAVLEVGLGGRLDAVNLIDADAAIVTTIDLDHQDWLGNDRDAIGREKAGIFREGRPAVIGELAPPRGLLDAALAAQARVIRAGVDFSFHPRGEEWLWQCGAEQLVLPQPTLRAGCQIANAAAAIAALYALRSCLKWNPAAIAQGVRDAQVPARLQCLRIGSVDLVVDVAHNPQAARTLADWLSVPARHDVAVRAVFSALGDKDIGGIVAALRDRIDHWHVFGLSHEASRGLTTEAVEAQVCAQVPAIRCTAHRRVEEALTQAFALSGPGELVVAFGSFLVAAGALRWSLEALPPEPDR